MQSTKKQTKKYPTVVRRVSVKKVLAIVHSLFSANSRKSLWVLQTADVGVFAGRRTGGRQPRIPVIFALD